MKRAQQSESERPFSAAAGLFDNYARRGLFLPFFRVNIIIPCRAKRPITTKHNILSILQYEKAASHCYFRLGFLLTLVLNFLKVVQSRSHFQLKKGPHCNMPVKSSLEPCTYSVPLISPEVRVQLDLERKKIGTYCFFKKNILKWVNIWPLKYHQVN